MTQYLYLKWSDSYNGGDPLIDTQHQTLFELANIALHSDTEDAFRTTVMRLFSYTRKHFVAEEELMAERNYSGLAQQQAIHKDLLSRLSQIANASDDNIPQCTSNLHGLMLNWILKHFLEDDIQIPHIG